MTQWMHLTANTHRQISWKQSGKDFLYLCFKRGGRVGEVVVRGSDFEGKYFLSYPHRIWRSWLLAGQCPQVWPGTAAAGCEAGRYLHILIHIYTSNTVCTGNEDTCKYRFTSAIESAQVMKIPAHTHLHQQYSVCTGNGNTCTYTFTPAIQCAQVIKSPPHTYLHQQYSMHMCSWYLHISVIYLYSEEFQCVCVCVSTHQVHAYISLCMQIYSFVLFVFCRDTGDISETVYEHSLQSCHYLSVISPCWNAQNNQNHCVAMFTITDPLTRLGFDESNTQDGLIQPIKVCQITPAQQANRE